MFWAVRPMLSAWVRCYDKLAAGGYIAPEEYKKKKKQILAGI